MNQTIRGLGGEVRRALSRLWGRGVRSAGGVGGVMYGLAALLSMGRSFGAGLMTDPRILVGPVTNEVNGRVYVLLVNSTWTQARQMARELGGHLATIRNEAEDRWVYGTFSYAAGSQRNLWIGLYDPDPFNDARRTDARRSEFVWESGEPVTYSNWANLEPNNDGSDGEYFVHLWYPSRGQAGRWNDLGDRTAFRFPMNGVVELSPQAPCSAGRRKWAFRTSRRVLASPLIGNNGRLFVGSGDGYLYALDAESGVERWRSYAGGPIEATPAAGREGSILVAAADLLSNQGSVRALDPATGRVRWVFAFAGGGVSSPAIAEDGSVLVVGAGARLEASRLYSLDGVTGIERWSVPAGVLQYSGGGLLYPSPAIGAAGRVLVSERGRLLALRSGDGSRIWDAGGVGGLFASPILGSDGRILFPTADGELTARVASSGASIWTSPALGILSVASASVAGTGSIFAGTQDGHLVAIDEASGSLRWRFVGSGRVNVTPAVGRDGTVYFGSGGGRLYAVDGRSGEARWEYNAGSAIVSSAELGADGTVYVGSEDGLLHAICGGGAGGLAEGSWPNFGGGGENRRQWGGMPTGASVVVRVGDGEVLEGDEGEQDLVFRVELSEPALAEVRVDYVTRDGTAVAGVDYRAVSGTLVFAAGETNGSIRIPVLGDRGIEPDETMSVRWTPQGEVKVSRPEVLGTLLNDDRNEPPVIAPIDDVVLWEDTESPRIRITVKDDRTEPTRIDVRVEGSDALLIPSAGLRWVWPEAGSNGALVMTPGAHRFGSAYLTVRATDDEGAFAERRFRVDVQPVNDLPVVRIAAPTNHQEVVYGMPVILRAEAWDIEGPVRRVEYFEGLTKLGDSERDPFVLTWTNLTVGTHRVQARAMDGEGGQASSETVEFRVLAKRQEPPTVAFAAPADGSEFDAGEPIEIAVLAEDSDGEIRTVELFENGRLMESLGSAPWRFTWKDAAVGGHRLVARATDEEGLSTTSMVRRVEVRDPQATVAILGVESEEEVRQLREYLSGLGRVSRVFAPDVATIERLTRFELLIWSQAGRDGGQVSLGEVGILLAWRRSHRPLYFIGEDLASAAARLPVTAREEWLDLVKLTSSGGLSVADSVTLEPEHVHYFGFATRSLGYSPARGGFEGARALADAQVLGRAGGADVLVAYPRVAEGEGGGTGRVATQNFWVYGSGLSQARVDRRLLFEAVVCWLMGCSRCAAFNVSFLETPAEVSARTGEPVEFRVELEPRYRCVSTGVRLDGELPLGWEWEGLTSGKGTASVEGRHLSVVIGEMNPDQKLTLWLRFRPTVPGTHLMTLHCRSNESALAGEEGQRTYRAEVTGAALPPRLWVERAGADIVIRWPDSGGPWGLEFSATPGAGAVWKPADGLPLRAGGQVVHRLPAAAPAGFFRLRN